LTTIRDTDFWIRRFCTVLPGADVMVTAMCRRTVTPVFFLPALLLAGTVAASRPAIAQRALPPDIAWLLKDAAQFPDDRVQALQRGEVISKAGMTDGELEAVVVAAVRVAAGKELTASYFRQIVDFVDGEVTLQHGLISQPPKAGDVAQLTLTNDERAELAACRPGDCAVRIGAAGAREVASAIDWKAPDAAAKADQWARGRVLAYVNDYLARGDEALITYNDKSSAVPLAREWAGIVGNSPALKAYAPDLQRYLTGFPKVTLRGVRDELYWDRQHFTGLRPILGVTHIVTWSDPARADRILIAQKQVYASHYFYGGLAVTLVLQDPKDVDPPATYVVYANRSRGDLLKGGFGGLRRRMAEQAVTSSAEDMLSSMKKGLEK
jgi:hypothetical protein